MDTKSESSQLFHLHIHSEYSLLDGATRIPDIVKKAQELGHSAIALTDHGNMFGAIEFYAKCKEAGIRPIIGVEIYWNGTSATDALSTEGLHLTRKFDAFHLVVLAKSLKGYHSLCRLISSPYLGQSRSVKDGLAIISREALAQHSDDLIALSSCLRGEFAALLELLASKCSDPIAQLSTPEKDLAPIVNALDQHVQLMNEIFGSSSYFIELIDNNLPGQKQLLPVLVAAAKHYKLPIVATADAHYLKPDDAEAHAVLTAIKNDLTMSDIRRRSQSAEFHIFSNQEMLEKYGAWPEALSNQALIAEQCQLNFKFGEYFLPRFVSPSGESEADALRRLSLIGLEDRFTHLRELYGKSFSEKTEEVYRQRLQYEVEVIISMGFPGYFLIVQDFINWAKDNDIPVGPGRGSGAGSIVAYALRITDIDPIKLNLIFERFLNPERVSMPDFDVDFCQDRRDEVIRYVTRKYGAENVAQITTFGKMKAKAALRDVGRVLQISYSKVDRIAKLIPNELDIKLADALAREPKILDEGKKDENIQKMLDLALKIEGLSRHTSVHAAGVVIAEGGMHNLVPVYKADDDALITQYEMKNAEKVGLVKFDFLGLKTLTVIDNAVKLIRATKNKNFDISKIDLEKKDVYDLISAAHSVGIFQLESSGMQNLLKKLKPSRFEDIIAVVALFRPGPLGSGMVDDFIERKHGRQELTYLHPRLEPILNDTYGIILYQEQVQKIAASLAHYSLGEADLLRRAMGKKKPEEMAKQKARFVSGCRANEVAESLAEEIFELMAKFAAYGFNKSHSAAYGLVSYQTAYLKTFFPEQFMAAIMTCDLDNTDKLVRYIEELRRLRFKLLAPNINRSFLQFDVPAAKTLGFGLSAIKGIGGSSVEVIIEERERSGPYKSLTDLAKRIDLHRVGKKTLELLIQAGALDVFGKNRNHLMILLNEMLKYSEAHHGAKNRGQRLLFEDIDLEGNESELAEWDLLPEPADVKGNPLDSLQKERKILGVFLSAHPCEHFALDIKRFAQLRIQEIPKHVGKKGMHCVAYLSQIRDRLTKTGKKMSYFTLEDETGSCEAVAFENDLTPERPDLNTLVIVKLSIQQSFDGMGINLRIEDIRSLEKARQSAVKRLTIQVHTSLDTTKPSMQTQLKLIDKLQQLVKNNPGQSVLNIELNFENANVKFNHEKLQIDPRDSVCQTILGMRADGFQLLY